MSVMYLCICNHVTQPCGYQNLVVSLLKLRCHYSEDCMQQGIWAVLL